MPSRPRSIMIADDDPEDCLLIKEAFAETNGKYDLKFFRDGECLLESLHGGEGAPGLILLDLNMPRKNGREVLKALREDLNLCYIPVVILTTSNLAEHIEECYALGANSYITKPSSFSALVDIMNCVLHYWFDLVDLPSPSCTLARMRAMRFPISARSPLI